MRVHLLLAVLMAAPLLAAGPDCNCASGRLTEASYSWDFSSEASSRFDQLKAEADHMRDTVEVLLAYATQPETLSREMYVAQLNEALRQTALMAELGSRLDSIHRLTTPEQRELIQSLQPLVEALARSAGDIQQMISRDYLARYSPKFAERLNTLSLRASRLSETVAVH